MKTYTVKETFGPTIQGEGFSAGESVYFLRFSGCNKWSGREEDRASSACPFCDTDFFGGKKMSVQDITEELKELRTKGRSAKRILVISGGEPTLQIDEPLLRALLS